MPTLQQVTILLDAYTGAGPIIGQGSAFFSPTALLTDTTDHLTIPQTPVAVSLVPPSGAAASWLPYVSLYSTDSSNLTPFPAGSWKYNCAFQFPGAPVPFTFSLVAGATGLSYTATNASPCVFTAAGSAYTAGEAVSLFGSGLPAGFSQATPYYVVSPSGTSFSLAATPGGAAIASTSTGSGTVIPCQFLDALAP